MTVDVSLWPETFSEKSFPSFPCPECYNGRLVLKKNSQDQVLVRTYEPKYSKAGRAHPDWEPDWEIQRFFAVLECSVTNCGEVSVASGDIILIQEFDEEIGRWTYVYRLRPKSILPAPPIIRIGKKVPHEVSEHVKAAFGLFWSDLGAAANRLRSALERVMDHRGIKKYNRTGHRIPISLAKRIEKYEAKYGDELSEVVDALRNVGNRGSHGTTSRTSVLGAFALFEHFLDKTYEKPEVEIGKIAKGLASKHHAQKKKAAAAKNAASKAASK